MECLAKVHADDLPEVLRRFQESVQTGEPRPIHYRVLQPNGEVTEVETIAQPVHDSSGCVSRVVGTVMDVTERNRIRDALRVSEQLARGQLEALMRMLDALAREASTDRLLEPILRTIAEQFGAYSMTVWLTDDASSRVEFAFQFLADRLLAGADAPHPAARLPLEGQDNPVWQAILSTKQYRICDDVRTDPDVPFREYNLAQGIVTILVVPMLVATAVVGMIAITFRERRTFPPEDIALAQALANQSVLSVQLMRLSEQSRRAAVIAERNRMARDVHDTLAQGLTGVIVQLEAADDAAAMGLDREAAAHRSRAAELARAGLQEARRSVLALRPQALEHQDLATALNDLVSRMATGNSLLAEFRRRGAPRPLPLSCEEHLLRIGQEALTNALRHARPRRVALDLIFDSGEVRLEVRDDGHGFDPAAPGDGNGLDGMRARAAAMGGRLTIESAADVGTTVVATLPL
jgi:signal transduction histidine kinase